MRRQQAHPNSRNLRSLTLPLRNSSIGVGSLHSSHSSSVMASLLAQDQVEAPATSRVRTWLPAVAEKVGGGATSICQNKCQVWQAVECPFFVDVGGQAQHGRLQPSTVEGVRAEGERPEDAAEERTDIASR